MSKSMASTICTATVGCFANVDKKVDYVALNALTSPVTTIVAEGSFHGTLGANRCTVLQRPCLQCFLSQIDFLRLCGTLFLIKKKSLPEVG